MNKDIIFIPNIQLGDKRSDKYHYSIKSWKKWADKNNKLLFEWTNLKYPVEDIKVTWQRWYAFDILESNGIEINDNTQIAIIDVDTIVHPNCPDFFELTENKLAAVKNDGSYYWVCESIQEYSKLLFEDTIVSPHDYQNNGLVVINNKHRNFLKEIQNFYWDNKEKIIKSYDEIEKSTDQTIINFLIKKYSIERKFLLPYFNLQDLYRKQLLPLLRWQKDSLKYMYMSGGIYHFNAIPQNPTNRDVNYFIERTYKELYGDE